jgi:Methyltransferase domain
MITTAQLRRQIRLMARTAGHLVRHPGDGREVTRLLRAGVRSTVRLRMPWLPFRLIDDLESRLQPGMKVFEFGGGGSTLWFLDHDLEVVTVEHDQAWSRVLQETAASPRWTLLVRPLGIDGTSYVGTIDQYPDAHFDLVVVDGRERARCVRASLAKIKPGGTLVVDDVDRERYARALERVGWPRTDVVGFAPAKPSLSYTAAFSCPDE